MILIGLILKKERIRKEISLRQVAKTLNISTYYLQAIENDEYSKTPGGVYTIGFVRSYADYLNLDSHEIINQYKKQISFSEKIKPIQISKPAETFSIFQLNRLASIIVFFGVSITFYYLFINKPDFQSEYAITSKIPEDLQSEIEKYEIEIALKDLNVKNNKEDTINLLENDLLNKNTKENYNDPAKVIASQSSKVDENDINNLISLKVINSTWIQIRNFENEIIHSKLMSTKDEYTYALNDNFFITTGNAGNIIVSIGGKIMGKLGKQGEVLDSISITPDYFSN